MFWKMKLFFGLLDIVLFVLRIMASDLLFAHNRPFLFCIAYNCAFCPSQYICNEISLTELSVKNYRYMFYYNFLIYIYICIQLKWITKIKYNRLLSIDIKSMIMLLPKSKYKQIYFQLDYHCIVLSYKMQLVIDLV